MIEEQMNPAMAAPMGEPMDDPMMDQGMDEEGGGISPEDQSLYEWIVVNGMTLMDGEETQVEILSALDGGDPVDALAKTAVAITGRVASGAADQGKAIDHQIVHSAMAEIMEHLADTAEAADIHDFSEKELKAAFIRASDELRLFMTENGMLDQEAAMADLEQLKAANDSGALEKTLGPMAQQAPADEAMMDEGMI